MTSIRQWLYNTFNFEPEYMGWKEYQGKIQFLEDFYFQQGVREENVRNIPPL